MADRAISELTAVTNVNADDSFVLQQNNRAMRLTGQVLLNWLAVALDGHGGISNIAKTSTSGLVDTYTITYADQTSDTFTVTNGKAIASIAKTGTSGLVDTYTITYNNGSPTTFTVTNGNGITSVAKTSTTGLVDTYTITFDNGDTETFTVSNGKGISTLTKIDTTGLVDTYRITYNDNTYTDFTVTNGEKGDPGDNTYTYVRYSTNSPSQDSDMHTTPDNWMGIYCGPASTAPTSYQSYQWFEIKGEKGETGDSVSIQSTAVDYTVGDDGSTVPSSGWQSTIPTVPQGKYLWTRTVVTYTDGTTQTSVTSYTSSRSGVDGSGSVNSVNNVSPDSNHNVTLPTDNVPTTNSGNYVKSSGVALVNSRHENCMAFPYDAESLYAVGDFCIYDNQLMRCIYPIEMGEAWDPAHWSNAVICTIINGILAEIDDVESGIAIVVNGNTAPKAISSGQYLFIKNHSSLANGGYHATSAIASGASITSSNVAADTDGIANALNNNIANLIKVSEFTVSVTTTADSNVIGGNRGEIIITSELDSNYNSNVKVTIPIQIVPTNATARILPCSSSAANKIRFLSPTAMSDQNVQVRVVYVYS